MSIDERTIGETPINEIVEIPMSGKKNVVMDATIMTSLMSCPRLSDFRFNHNFQSIGGKSNSLECGSIVHMYLEYMYKAIINGISKEQAHGFGMAAAELYIKGCPTCSDFTASVEHPKPVCGHKPNEFPGVRNTPKESEGYKTGWHWVLDTCEQYNAFYRNDHWVPLEVETVKGEVLYEDDEVRVLWKAKLDLTADTNQGIYPVDHKTMKQNRPNINLNNQFTGQCLVMKTRQVIINKVGFQTGLKPAEKFIRKPIGYSASRLMEWQSEILPYYAKLLLMYAETGHFPPNYDHCEGKYGACAFLKVCDADPEMREEIIRQDFIVGPVWNPTNDED